MATGIFKQLRYKVETNWAELPAASGYKILRRKSSTLDEVRETYTSDEQQASQQRTIFVHGARHAEGSIVGDLSPGTYADLYEALLRRDFTTVTAMAGLSITIAAGSGSAFTVARGTGSFLTDGVKVGMVVQLTAGTFNTANSAKNLFVQDISVDGLTLTVIPWGGAMIPEGPIASATVSVPGKITYIPSSAHTNKSFTFEHAYTDVGTGQFEVFSGCRVGSADFNLPSTGLIETTIGVMGKGFAQAPGTTTYFTGSSTTTSTAGITAVNGQLQAGSGMLTSVTGATLRINGNMSVGTVLGSNYTPNVYAGLLIANGQLTAYFDSATMRDAFYNESVIGLNLVAYAGTAKGAPFVAFTLPAIKLGAAQRNDVPGPIILTSPFEALYNSAGGTGIKSEATSVWMQDSTLT